MTTIFSRNGVEAVKKGGVAIVNLGRAPVNSMNQAFWTDLTDVLNMCEGSKDVRGLIFQSTLPKPVFTAGNDVKELFAPMTSKEKYGQFWISSNHFLVRLLRSRLVTMTLIKGACPAGGTCLALCTDYRIMSAQAGRSYMGLNEVALGIAVPKYWGDLMGQVIGKGKASVALMFAKFFNPIEAKDVGLVHELVETDADLLPRGESVMREFLKLPDYGRIKTKLQLVEDFSREWEAFLPEEAEGAWDMLSAPQTVAALGAVIEKLSGKSSEKSKL